MNLTTQQIDLIASIPSIFHIGREWAEYSARAERCANIHIYGEPNLYVLPPPRWQKLYNLLLRDVFIKYWPTPGYTHNMVKAFVKLATYEGPNILQVGDRKPLELTYDTTISIGKYEFYALKWVAAKGLYDWRKKQDTDPEPFKRQAFLLLEEKTYQHPDEAPLAPRPKVVSPAKKQYLSSDIRYTKPEPKKSRTGANRASIKKH